MKLAFTDFGGSGDLLVLGPSLGTSARTLWSAAVEKLAGRYHAVGWDLPGHGDSPAASPFSIGDLAAAVSSTVTEPFHYAAVSLGGAVGLQLLLDAPHQVTSATLIATGARIGAPTAWQDRAARVRREGMAFLVEETPARWFSPGREDTLNARQLLADLARTDAESYAAACDALAAFDVRSRLPEIAQPVLAIAGAHDPVTPPHALRHIADGVQHGRLVVLGDASHLATAEVPDEIAPLIAAHLPPDGTTVAQVRAEGMRVRREVLGDQYVDRASAAADEFTAEFQEFITGYAWGSIWTRPGLDRRSRSLITLTALVARGHHDELAMHLRAALRNGLTKDEIKELLLQTAIYCGVPDANTAFRIAQRVFEEEEA
jgi:3-oxoadipate enol-lactonase/4-carboxymuconolactone decarboxylase